MRRAIDASLCRYSNSGQPSRTPDLLPEALLNARLSKTEAMPLRKVDRSAVTTLPHQSKYHSLYPHPPSIRLLLLRLQTWRPWISRRPCHISQCNRPKKEPILPATTIITIITITTTTEVKMGDIIFILIVRMAVVADIRPCSQQAQLHLRWTLEKDLDFGLCATLIDYHHPCYLLCLLCRLASPRNQNLRPLQALQPFAPPHIAHERDGGHQSASNSLIPATLMTPMLMRQPPRHQQQMRISTSR